MHVDKGKWYVALNMNTPTEPWKRIMQSPEWYSHCSRGCTHPDGVILAGSHMHLVGMTVELMDMRRGKRVRLPDLPYPVAQVGIAFDDDRGVLAITGGNYYHDESWKRCRRLFMLEDVSENGEWEEHSAYLPFGVLNPTLVFDDEYLYCLGGYDNFRSVRINNIDPIAWQEFAPLPNFLNNMSYGDALCINNTITVLSLTHRMTLQSIDGQLFWYCKAYRDETLESCIPVVCNREILAFIDRGDTNTVESLHPQNNTWQPRFQRTSFWNTPGLYTFSYGSAKFSIVKFKRNHFQGNDDAFNTSDYSKRVIARH